MLIFIDGNRTRPVRRKAKMSKDISIFYCYLYFRELFCYSVKERGQISTKIYLNSLI